MRYDCIIIGGGVVGVSVLDRLARFDISALLLEKEEDVAAHASRANSGIVHAGYDCEPNTLKARFNVRGNELMWQVAKELDVPHLRCHSIVVAEKDQLSQLKDLAQKAVENGVDVEILDRKQTLEIEPNVAQSIEYSLFAESAGVISPYKLTIGLADRAIVNGAKIVLDAEVSAIKKQNDIFTIFTSKGEFEARIVINCAGANGSRVNEFVGAEQYDLQFRRGDYFVVDSTERSKISTVIFPLPTIAGKGILVAPTADGNILYGPTSNESTAFDTASTPSALDEIKGNVPLTYSAASFNKCIRVYSGVRTVIGKDFVIKQSEIVPSFFMAIGICSPGLTSAPAIAEYIEEIVRDIIPMKMKENFVTTMPKKLRLVDLSKAQLNELVAKDNKWGRIVCRCEKVTEAEIVAAIHSPLVATSVDAIKRRTRAGMGRCQGGFCATRVLEILARELNLPLDAITKSGKGSEIAMYHVGEVSQDGTTKIKNSNVNDDKKNETAMFHIGEVSDEI